MLKRCTVLTSDEVDEILHDLSYLIETLEYGSNGDDDPTAACDCALDQARAILKKFD